MIPRSAPPKRSNPARKKREFKRCYGSAERVAFVKSLPCIVAHARDCDGEIENAHVISGGAGRKADASCIAPLCRRHHSELHAIGANTFQLVRCVQLLPCAAETNIAWCRIKGIDP